MALPSTLSSVFPALLMLFGCVVIDMAFGYFREAFVSLFFFRQGFSQKGSDILVSQRFCHLDKAAIGGYLVMLNFLSGHDQTDVAGGGTLFSILDDAFAFFEDAFHRFALLGLG